MANVFFSIGSNLGDRSVNLQSSVRELQDKVGFVKSKSSLYESEPWGYADNNQYLNQVLWLESEMFPLDILNVVLEIEKDLGRVRSDREGYEGRVIDIDLLIYNDVEIQTRTLTVPHPKMHLRNFVLIPLAEIAPDVIHPVLRQTIAYLRDDCNDKAQVKIIEEV